jgi:hypothetical protein
MFTDIGDIFVHFVFIFSGFGIIHQEKSSNPDLKSTDIERTWRDNGSTHPGANPTNLEFTAPTPAL